MSKVSSSSSDLTINADGASSALKLQIDGVEKASISSAGAFTSTTIDATKLSGALPAIDGSALTGLAAKNIVMKTTQNELSATADVTIVEVDIVAAGANPYFNIAGIVSLNTRAAANLDHENIQIDIDYSLDAGSSWSTLANEAYSTDVFSPGQDDTHNNTYDVMVRHPGTRGQVTMSAGATVRFRLHLDYGSVINSRTIYFNRGASTKGQGATSIIVYEE